MNIIDLNIIKKYFISFIEIVAHIFNFFEPIYNSKINDPSYKLKLVSGLEENFVDKGKTYFSDENFINLKWLLTLLLPYINETFGSKKDITSFNDIIKNKIKDGNLNSEIIKYRYSNFQYDRCVRDYNNIREIEFNEEFIRDNYYLLIQTLKVSCNKLHTNWIDVLPYSLRSFSNSTLYINTLKRKNNKTLTDWDPMEICNPDNFNNSNFSNILKENIKGLNIGVIYDTIRNVLYEQIKDIKWTIFDVPIINFKNYNMPSNNSIPLIFVFYELFDLKKIFQSNKKRRHYGINFQILRKKISIKNSIIY